MSITKSKIQKNIVSRTALSNEDGAALLEFFLLKIKEKSKSSKVKLSGFGTFSLKKTLKRYGRNPKTLDSYIIPVFNKFSFKASNKIKEKMNL